MVGGRLNIWPIGADDDELAESLTVTPAENKVLRFRGDALHQVLKHQSPHLKQSRVSLVVEQYVVPERYYSALPRFYVASQEDDNEALLPLWADGSLPPRDDALPRDAPPWSEPPWTTGDEGDEKGEGEGDDKGGDGDDSDGDDGGGDDDGDAGGADAPSSDA
jgi:hypothetical protein